MGLLEKIFGRVGERVASSENEVERDARKDYLSEYKETEEDPIPSEPPDWAEDLGPER